MKPFTRWMMAIGTVVGLLGVLALGNPFGVDAGFYFKKHTSHNDLKELILMVKDMLPPGGDSCGVHGWWRDAIEGEGRWVSFYNGAAYCDRETGVV